jgi:hypothetical protein
MTRYKVAHGVRFLLGCAVARGKQKDGGVDAWDVEGDLDETKEGERVGG